MNEWVKDGKRRINQEQDPWKKTRMEQYLALMQGDLERSDLDLEAIWQKQSQNFIKCNFHIEIGFADTDEGKQAYLETLPKFEPKPQEFEGRVDLPMLIEKQIPWERQAELAGIDISGYLQDRIAQTTVWKDNHSKAPDVAYAAWFNKWGQVFPDKISPDDARKDLPADLTGGDPFEGIAHEIHHPEDTANGKYFYLIGYSGGPGGVPCLSRWHGRPRLSARWVGSAGSDFRPLIRGSKIVTL